MDTFSAIRMFVSTVELGSFSRAAEAEGIKVSTVSRYITALEAELGTRLLSRSTRRLHLTEAGTQLYERATRILAELEDTKLEVSSLDGRPRGRLRLSLPIAFGRRHVVPHLKDFLAEHPEIKLDITLTDETVDLIAKGVDVAVRIGALADSRLVAKRLAPHHRVVVASPELFRNRAAPQEPADLRSEECVLFSLQPQDAWYFRRAGEAGTEPMEVSVSGRVNANNSEALLDMTVAGVGISLLPTWLAGEAIKSGQLIRLLPEWEALIAPGPERAIWGVYPSKKFVAPKVRAFLGFLDRRFGQPPYWDAFLLRV